MGYAVALRPQRGQVVSARSHRPGVCKRASATSQDGAHLRILVTTTPPEPNPWGIMHFTKHGTGCVCESPPRRARIMAFAGGSPMRSVLVSTLAVIAGAALLAQSAVLNHVVRQTRVDGKTLIETA